MSFFVEGLVLGERFCFEGFEVRVVVCFVGWFIRSCVLGFFWEKCLDFVKMYEILFLGFL